MPKAILTVEIEYDPEQIQLDQIADSMSKATRRHPHDGLGDVQFRKVQPLACIYTAVISHRHGTNHYVALSQEDIDRQIADYCRGEWHEVRDLDDVPEEPPADDIECFQTYFEAWEIDLNGETLDTERIPLTDMMG